MPGGRPGGARILPDSCRLPDRRAAVRPRGSGATIAALRRVPAIRSLHASSRNADLSPSLAGLPGVVRRHGGRARRGGCDTRQVRSAGHRDVPTFRCGPTPTNALPRTWCSAAGARTQRRSCGRAWSRSARGPQESQRFKRDELKLLSISAAREPRATLEVLRQGNSTTGDVTCSRSWTATPRMPPNCPPSLELGSHPGRQRDHRRWRRHSTVASGACWRRLRSRSRRCRGRSRSRSASCGMRTPSRPAIARRTASGGDRDYLQ